MRPYVAKCVEHNWDAFHCAPNVPKDVIVDNLMNALTRTRNTVFIKAPTVQAPKWPEHIRMQFF